MDDEIAAYLEAQVDSKMAQVPRKEAENTAGTLPVIPKRSSRDSRSRSRSKDHSRPRDRRDRSPSRDRERDRRKRSRSRDGDRRRSSRSADRSRHDHHHRYEDRGRDRDRDRDRGGREYDRDKDRERDRNKGRRDDSDVSEAPAVAAEPLPIVPPKTAFELSQEKEAARRQKELDDLTKDQRTIFVGQLTMKVTEQHLKTFFGQLGTVRGVIMVRDKSTGKHKGFGYVEMESLDTIGNCLLCNNIVPDFQKFPILVKASEAEKNFVAKKETPMYDNQPQNDGRLYIGNLHVNVTESELKDVLTQCGPVDMVSIHRDELGVSKTFAFVKYSRAEDAASAMNKLGGFELMGKPLRIGYITPDGGSSSHSTGTAGSANWKLDDDDGGGMQLNAHSRAMLMNKLGQAAGLTMPKPVMPPVMGSMNAAPPIVGLPTRCFKIKNMFDPATETEPGWDLEVKEDVTEECSKFGGVEHCYVESKRPGGIVFVRFSNTDASREAAASLNGRFFAGRQISIEYIDPAKYSTLF